jgi:hypothetical protein
MSGYQIVGRHRNRPDVFINVHQWINPNEHYTLQCEGYRYFLPNATTPITDIRTYLQGIIRKKAENARSNGGCTMPRSNTSRPTSRSHLDTRGSNSLRVIKRRATQGHYVDFGDFEPVDNEVIERGDDVEFVDDNGGLLPRNSDCLYGMLAIIIILLCVQIWKQN